MNGKKVNWLFLIMVALHFLVVFLLGTVGAAVPFGITANLICSELIIMVPAVIFYFAVKGGNRDLGFHKMKPSTVGMTVVFTFLTMPLTTLINAISMLFVDNAVAEISGDVLNTPFVLIFFLMAVYGPFCEEFVFRGMIYRGYKRDNTKGKAIILSALLFGIIHMNLNQMPYAFVIGILLAFLVEATGSLWSSMLYHMIFNAQTVCLMYLSDYFMPGVIEEQNAVTDKSMLLYAIGGYLIVALVTTSIAVCALMWIAKNEGREKELQGIWVKQEKN